MEPEREEAHRAFGICERCSWTQTTSLLAIAAVVVEEVVIAEVDALVTASLE
jgi:hypothetical protein